MTDFKPFFNSLENALIIHDVAGSVIYINEEGRQTYKQSIKKLRETGVSAIFNNPDTKKYQAVIKKLVSLKASSDSLENILIPRAGTNQLVDVSFNTLVLGDKSYIVAVIHPKAEETRDLLSSINKNISDGIYRSHPDGKMVYANDAFMRMFGFSSIEEVLKTNPAVLYKNPKDRDKVVKMLRGKNGVKNHEVLFKKKDGTTFWGAMSTKRTRDAFGNLIFDGAIRDINEFKTAQMKMEENQQLLESINKNISEGIYRSYTKGGLIYANESFAKMFGYKSAAELLAVDSLDLYADPSDRKGLTPQIQKEGFKTNVETLFKRKDGSTFWGLNSYILAKDKDGNSVFDGAVRDIHMQKMAEEKLKNLNDQLIERNSELALKESELQASNEELIANSQNLVKTLDELSERNFELDQLIYRTSHDLRAPLRSVLGLTNIMKMEKAELTPEYLEKIEERIQRMDDFIKAMLEYSRTSRMGIVFKEIDLEELINDCISDLEYLEGFDDMEIKLDFKGGKKKVECDELRVKIIFGNIISNAYKYKSSERKFSFLNIKTKVSKKRFTVTFEDNGIGISKKYQERIFDMFFRATEKSDGSGLGMYLVKQSVDKLGGKLDLKSAKGKGTTIKIDLPNS